MKDQEMHLSASLGCSEKFTLPTSSPLQLYFRLSATTLKLLEGGEPDLEHELLFTMLAEAATGPFARGEEKSMPSMPRSHEKWDIWFVIISCSTTVLGPSHWPPSSILSLTHSREKPSSMMDEDSRCSLVCAATVLGTSLPSGAPGLTSPPYTATPVDHDYAKRKTLRRQQQWQQQQQHEEQQADGTVPVLDTASLHWDRKSTEDCSDHHANGFGFGNNDPHMHWVIGMW